MRSSLGTLGSCDNSKLNFDLKITCCYRQKPEKKIRKKRVSGKSIVDEINRSSSRIKEDVSIQHFEIYGTPISFEQCKNNSPYRTRIYSNYHSFCGKRENANNTNRLDKNNSTKQSRVRENNYHRSLDQDRYLSSFKEKPKKLVNRKPVNPIVIPRVPLEVKSSLFPKSRTNFHNFKEPPLFSSTEEARRAIVHVLNCVDEKFLQNKVRPLVSGNVMSRYIQDVYEYLYNRHIETLNNVVTVELPPHRRSIHIHNKEQIETVDAIKNESSEEDSENSEGEDLAEDFEHVSIDQPLVKVSPLSVT